MLSSCLAMTTTGQLGWRELFLILTVLPCCCSLQVSIQEKEYMVARGGNITLTCSFRPARPDFQIYLLTWEVYTDNIDAGSLDPVATYYPDNPVEIGSAYKGRALLEVDLNNKVSKLHLAKVTMQDSRRYKCSVRIPTDAEGTVAATTLLLVTEPPSAPICRLQGTAEYWHNISLTCMSEEGSPKPKYNWKSYSVENKHRDFPPKTTEKDGILSLFNISQEMSGYYICTSANAFGSASCNFTLAVMPNSMNIGSTGIIIVGVLAAVIVVGILIFCCYRKRNKKNKYAEGYQGEEFYDSTESRKQYWDDKSNSETKQHNQSEDKDVNTLVEDDQHSSVSAKERHDGKGSDIDSQHRGSRDHLDNQRDHYGGSHDRLDDQCDRYSGSRDRLDDKRDRYGGSRDRLDDQRERYGGSRDRLDDKRDRYGGSRDRLDDRRDQYDRYGGSRDRLDDQRDRCGGSRDRLDYRDDQYRN